MGQNLGAMAGVEGSFDLIMKLFYDEKKDYDYENHQWAAGKMVGHYLQVIITKYRKTNENVQSLIVSIKQNVRIYLIVHVILITMINAVY